MIKTQAPDPAQVLIEDRTVYTLNAKGVNRWWFSVQPGQDDDGARISDAECVRVAERARAAFQAPEGGHEHRPQWFLDGKTAHEFVLDELYEWQQATGCDNAAQFREEQAKSQAPAEGDACEAFEQCAEEIERGEPWISREAASAIIRKHARAANVQPKHTGQQGLTEDVREFLYRVQAFVPFDQAAWFQQRSAAINAALRATPSPAPAQRERVPAEWRGVAAAIDATRDAYRPSEVEWLPLDVAIRLAQEHPGTVTVGLVQSIAKAVHQLRSPAVKAEVPADMVLVPREPTPGLLMSMALRYDHGLGMPGYYDDIQQMLPEGHPEKGITHARRLESTLTTMRQLHEEVVGAGFYKPEREASYAAMGEAKPPVQHKEQP